LTTLPKNRAYEGNETCEKAKESGLIPVVSPKKNHKNPWYYDKEIDKRRNEIELRIHARITLLKSAIA
jgi:hypothetical protein